MVEGRGVRRARKGALWLAVAALGAAVQVARGAAVPVALGAAVPVAPPAAAEPPRAGDPAAGRALFTGARVLAAGGAPCGACHASGGEGAPFAASLGPELSSSFDGMDAETLDGLLQDLPFPTMAPIFGAHALTPGERADLAAYLLQASGKPAPRGGGIALRAGLVAAALLGLVALAGRRRKRPTRAGLIAHSPRGGGSR